MSYFTTEHFDNNPVSRGPDIGFFDGISKSFEAEKHVYSPLALETDLNDAWKDNLQQLLELTGEEFQAPSFNPAIVAYAKELETGELAQAPNPAAAKFFDQEIQKLRAADERIKALGNPELKSFADILTATKEERVRYQSEAEDVGLIPSLIGGIGAAINPVRDPATFFTLPLGGWGRTVARRIGTEILVGGAASTPGIFQTQETMTELGEGSINPLQQILIGALAAGGLRGAFEIPGVIGRKVSPKFDQLDFEDAQLRSMFEAAPQSPRARAGLDILEGDAKFRTASPYGDSEGGLARFEAELGAMARVLGGRPDTAIARVLPEVPWEFIEKNADFALVREQVPVVYDRMRAAQAELDAVDARIKELTDRVESPNVLAALERTDPETAGLIRSYEEDLANPQLTREKRADIERRINQIVETLGPEKLAKLENDITIQPRAELKSTRASRKAANKRYKVAYRAVEAEVQKIKARELIIKGTQPAPVPLGAPVSRVLGDSMELPVVAQRVIEIDEAAEKIDDVARQIIARGDDPEVPTPDDGLVNIGLTEKVDGDFRYPDEDGTVKTFREAVKDLQEDEDLELAMRTCAI